MNDRNRRSAAEVMANAARVVKAAVNIVRAAIAGGLHGAAAAAAKELLPTIIKFAVGVLIAIIVIPMFVISAMPNMFFGYETSQKDSQITMREQALSVGGAYLSLEDSKKRRWTRSLPALQRNTRTAGSMWMRSMLTANLTRKIFAGTSPSTPSRTNKISARCGPRRFKPF